MKIRSIDRTIDELFSSSYYKIPRFQRPYSWDSENIEEFWNDTIADIDQEEDYFIGSIVLYQDSDNYLSIVDGQQRLTTVTLIFCALRDIFLKENFKDLSDGAQGIIEKLNRNNKKQFVLKTESSYPYLQEKILNANKTDTEIELTNEELNLKNAYEYFQKRLEKTVESIYENPAIGEERKKEEIEKSLIHIREKILRLKLIFIELGNEDEAYLIFETLNTRGKDLTISDLLRNFFTKNIKSSHKDVDSAKSQWENVLTVINGSSAEINVDTYIHHYWLSKYSFLPAKKLFKTVKKDIKGVNVQYFLNDLVENSKYYRQLFETTFVNWQQNEIEIKRSLNALNLFKVKQPVPLMLSIIRAYRQGIIKPKNVISALRAIENFHFLFTAVTSQRSSGGISQMYVNCAISFDKAKNTQDKNKIMSEFKVKLKKRIPAYDEFLALFKEIIYTVNYTKSRSLMRYILSKYDSLARAGIIIDYENMTIEHLISQSYVRDDNSEVIIGMIGNQILVDNELNKKLSNKPIKDKIKILEDNNFPIDENIKDINELDLSTVVNRTEKMAKVAYNKIWEI